MAIRNLRGVPKSIAVDTAFLLGLGASASLPIGMHLTSKRLRGIAYGVSALSASLAIAHSSANASALLYTAAYTLLMAANFSFDKQENKVIGRDVAAAIIHTRLYLKDKFKIKETPAFSETDMFGPRGGHGARVALQRRNRDFGSARSARRL